MGSGRMDAVRFLEELVQEHQLRREERLPSVREMASRAGVALATMVYAVRRMESRGLVVCRRGSGIRLGSSTPVAAANAPRTKWARVRQRVQEDLTSGLFVPGEPLPSVKELSVTYGGCRATLAKALRSLVRDGLLQPRRSGFQVPSLRSGAASNRVVLLLPMRPDRFDAELFPRTQEALRILEAECTRSKVRLDINIYNAVRDRVYSRGGTPVCSAGDVHTLDALGIMVWCMGVPGPELSSGLLAGLHRATRPVAVWDDYDEETVAPPKGRTRMRVFTSAGGYCAGRAVGRAVHECGHSSVAYLSAVHASPWSRARLAGLSDPVEVTPCTLSRLRWAGDFRRRDEFRHVSDHYERLARGLAGLAEHDPFSRGAVEHLRRSLDEAVDRQVYRDQMTPLFEAALGTDATVWVAAADSAAGMALQFLREKGRRVPEDISLVGFDDSLEASLRGIASYSFNEPALVRAMLGHILGSPTAPGPRQGTVVEIPGFVVQRSSLQRRTGA